MYCLLDLGPDQKLGPRRGSLARIGQGYQALTLVLALCRLDEAEIEQLADRAGDTWLADADRRSQRIDREGLRIERSEQGHMDRLDGKASIRNDTRSSRLHPLAQPLETASQKHRTQCLQYIIGHGHPYI
jgi:hypothetical protein